MRVNAYIDGFNFYYGCREKNWRHYYWLNFCQFISTFLIEGQELQHLYYFTSTPLDNGKKNRQAQLLKANRLDGRFSTIQGKFIQEPVKGCRCGRVMQKEKQTDVNIAVQLIDDVHANACDLSILVTGDSDLMPALKLAKRIRPGHEIIALFPPKRHCGEFIPLLKAHYHLEKYESRIRDCQFPPEILDSNGYPIRKPEKWS